MPSKVRDAVRNAEYYVKNRSSIRAKAKSRRRENVASAVLLDARRSDRKRGRSNNLDLLFVQELLSHPCAYCGETSLRMTLDRVDNGLGHLKENVVQACERCNYARRDMPFAAWEVVASAMATARERNLFGTWTGGIHRRHSLPILVFSDARLKPVRHGTLTGYGRCGPPRCDLCKKAMRDWQRVRRARK